MLLVRRVSGNSMLPTLQSGRIVLGYRWFYRLKPGDVVILRHNGLEKIKRIVAVNSQGISVQGDNRKESTDSRHFGAVPKSTVIAKLLFTKR